MKNAVIGGLVVALIAVVLWFGVIQKQMAPSSTVTASLAPTQTPTINASDLPLAQSPTPKPVGTVEGKLCYPSQFLPKGEIHAKNVQTNEIVVQAYPGSQNGGKSTYSLELPAGTYILRYEAQVDPNTVLYGYHTKTCPTGLETTCAAQYPREHLQVQLTNGGVAKNVDLCDFYYDDKKPPVF